MKDAEKLTAIVAAYAKSTLLLANRLSALERAMQEDYSSHSLWDRYAKQVGLATNRVHQLLQKRELLADQELDDAIAELRKLSKER